MQHDQISMLEHYLELQSLLKYRSLPENDTKSHGTADTESLSDISSENSFESSSDLNVTASAVEAMLTKTMDRYQEQDIATRGAFLRKIFGCQKSDQMNGISTQNFFIALINKIINEPNAQKQYYYAIFTETLSLLQTFVDSGILNERNLYEMINTLTEEGTLNDIVEKNISKKTIAKGFTFIGRNAASDDAMKHKYLLNIQQQLSAYVMTTEQSFTSNLQKDIVLAEIHDNMDKAINIDAPPDSPIKTTLYKNRIEKIISLIDLSELTQNLLNDETAIIDLSEQLSEDELKKILGDDRFNQLQQNISNLMSVEHEHSPSDEYLNERETAKNNLTQAALIEVFRDSQFLSRLKREFNTDELTHIFHDHIATAVSQVSNELYTKRSLADVEFIREQILILSEKNPTYRDHKGRTPLIYACLLGDDSLIEELITREKKYVIGHNKFLDISDNNHQSPLHYAINLMHDADDNAIAYALIRPDNEQKTTLSGCDLSSQDNYGHTALMKAIYKGYDTVVEWIIKSHASQEATDRQGNTALHLAIRGQSLKKLHKYIDSMVQLPGCDLTLKNTDGHTALMLSVLYRKDFATKSILKASESGINIRDHHGKTALLLALELNNTAAALAILQSSKKIDCSSQNESGQTALMIAIREGHNDIAKRILEHSQADEHATHILDHHKTSALMYCVQYDNEEMLNILSRTTDVNLCDNEGHTAYSRAVSDGKLAYAELIVENSKYFDTNIKNPEGEPPLINAIKTGQSILASKILDKPNVAINDVDANGASALHYSIILKNDDILHKILKHENLHINDSFSGKSPFVEAMSHGNFDTALLLTQHKNFDASFNHFEGKNPLEQAIIAGKMDIIHSIITHHTNTCGILSSPQEKSHLKMALEGDYPDNIATYIINGALKLPLQEVMNHLEKPSMLAYARAHGKINNYLLNLLKEIDNRPKPKFYESHELLSKTSMQLLESLSDPKHTQDDIDGILSSISSKYQSLHDMPLTQATYLRLLFSCQKNPHTPNNKPTSILLTLFQNAIAIQNKKDQDHAFEKLNHIVTLLGDPSGPFQPHGLEIINAITQHTSLLDALSERDKGLIKMIKKVTLRSNAVTPESMLYTTLLKYQRTVDDLLEAHGETTESPDDATVAYWKEQTIMSFHKNPNSKNSDGNTAIMQAILSKNEMLALELLNNSTDINPNIQNNSGYTALMLAIKMGFETLAIKLLEKNKIDINIDLKNNLGQTALHLSTEMNQMHIFTSLLNSKASPNMINSDHETPLMIAINTHQTHLALLLLQQQSLHLNSSNKSGQTALQLSIINHQEDIFNAIIQLCNTFSDSRYRAHLLQKDNSGNDALSLALDSPDPKYAIQLLKMNHNGLNQEEKQSAWTTLLNQAITRNNPIALNDIIAELPNPESYLDDAFYLALTLKHEEIARFIYLLPSFDIFKLYFKQPYFMHALTSHSWIIAEEILDLYIKENKENTIEHALKNVISQNTDQELISANYAYYTLPAQQENFMHDNFYKQSTTLPQLLLASAMPDTLRNKIFDRLPKQLYEKVIDEAFQTGTKDNLVYLIEKNILKKEYLLTSIKTCLQDPNSSELQIRKLCSAYIHNNKIKLLYPILISLLKDPKISIRNKQELVRTLRDNKVDINYQSSFFSFSIRDRIFIQQCNLPKEERQDHYPLSMSLLCNLYILFQGNKIARAEKNTSEQDRIELTNVSSHCAPITPLERFSEPNMIVHQHSNHKETDEDAQTLTTKNKGNLKK